MSLPASSVPSFHVCPMVDGVKPHVGGPVVPPGAAQVWIGGKPAARVADIAACTGPPDVITVGALTVLFGGMPAARLTDNAAHGGNLVVGDPSVLIGGPAGSPTGAMAAVLRSALLAAALVKPGGSGDGYDAALAAVGRPEFSPGG